MHKDNDDGNLDAQETSKTPVARQGPVGSIFPMESRESEDVRRGLVGKESALAVWMGSDDHPTRV